MTCVRHTLVAFSLLIWVAGCVSVGFAGYVMVEDMKFKGLTGNQMLDGSLLGLSCFVFVAGLCGCVGAALQKRTILKVFFVLLAIFLLGQITLVVLYFVQRNQLSALMSENWNKMTDEGRIKIQKELKCCGMKSSEETNSFKDASCFASNSTRYETCFKKIEALIDSNMLIIGGCGGGVMLIQLLTLILTYLLIRETGRETSVVPINSGRDRNWQTRAKGPPIRVQGVRQIESDYDDGDDMYMEEYEDPPNEHMRKEWAKRSYRQEWRKDKQKH